MAPPRHLEEAAVVVAVVGVVSWSSTAVVASCSASFQSSRAELAMARFLGGWRWRRRLYGGFGKVKGTQGWVGG
jgi:hypothetical protein